jgi:hypothetical protein
MNALYISLKDGNLKIDNEQPNNSYLFSKVNDYIHINSNNDIEIHCQNPKNLMNLAKKFIQDSLTLTKEAEPQDDDTRNLNLYKQKIQDLHNEYDKTVEEIMDLITESESVSSEFCNIYSQKLEKISIEDINKDCNINMESKDNLQKTLSDQTKKILQLTTEDKAFEDQMNSHLFTKANFEKRLEILNQESNADPDSIKLIKTFIKDTETIIQDIQKSRNSLDLKMLTDTQDSIKKQIKQLINEHMILTLTKDIKSKIIEKNDLESQITKLTEKKSRNEQISKIIPRTLAKKILQTAFDDIKQSSFSQIMLKESQWCDVLKDICNQENSAVATQNAIELLKNNYNNNIQYYMEYEQCSVPYIWLLTIYDLILGWLLGKSVQLQDNIVATWTQNTLLEQFYQELDAKTAIAF